MLTLNKVNVLENQPAPKTQDISNWPLLDSRGNSLDDLGSGSRAPKKVPEKNHIKWREKTPETEDEAHPAPIPVDELDFSDEDDLDGEEEEMEAIIKNKIGNSERNYMYPEHEPGKHDPAKPPMLKFKSSLFSRNVLVVNRALRKFMNKDKETEEDRREEELDKRMTRRGEGRVQSSKRRQQMSLRNQYAELTVNYDDLLKENKLLKQIQKRQERELDRFTNADEDLPRLLDANNYEIAGLKAKNKQLLFEKREQDDKLRRQHQEIMTLKEENKKMTTLANNRKLGEREKLELELTTARVTIAHQENKIQDLTKAVEIYKKAADREVRGGQLQLRKAQNSLRDLQDAYNELFIKYKAKEKELGNQNIYAQRGRISSKRSHFRAGPSTQSNPNLSVQSFVSTTTPAAVEKREDKILKSQTSNLSSIERLESELELLNKQSDSLADLEKVLEEDKSPEPPTKSPPPKSPPRSPSTLASDSEDDLDEEEVKPTAPVKEPTPKPTKVATPTPATPAKTEISPPEPVSELQQRIQEEARLAQEFEKKKQEEAAKLAEEEKRKAKAAEEKARQAEEAAEAEAKRKAEEAKARKAEEERLLLERKKKDDALKEKLAAVRRNAGADDFMSQLKAKKNTPSVSPSESLKSDVRSPPAPAPTERVPRKSGSGDELRRVAALNNVNGRRKKSSEEDFTSGYQPSFATSRPVAGKIDPFGIEVNTVSEYTPSFSNNQRISRESANNSKVWTPTGRASTSERNGLFETSLDHKPLLKRRASKSKNMIPVKTYDQDDDLEELLL